MKLSIGFTGDIAFSEYTKEFYKNKEAIDKNIYEFLNQNDYNILNFESPVTESTITSKNSLAHKSNPETIPFIKNNIKNPILSLANNHMMDFGPKGMVDTLNYIEKEKIDYIGAGRNSEDATKYLILGDDIKVGVLSFQYKNYRISTENTPGPAHEKHIKLINKKIKELKKKVDWVVVVYHGGEEFLNTPMPYTRRKLRKLLNAGADIVVAHHPHTVQGYEKIGSKMIFYSLGNFIFDTEFQRAQTGTERGMLIRLIFDKKSFTYESLSIAKNRDEDKLIAKKSDINFKNIKPTYRKDWKSEARRLTQVKENKKELRKYRKHFSISNLYIEKAECENLIPFEDLIKNNYIEELENEIVFSKTNIIVRKLKRIYRKLKNTN